MQLQRSVEDFDRAGVALFALSYDEPDALAAFRDEYGITFTLLSDPDSEVIRSFGILNTLVPEDDHPWFGIPFPGAYVTDADGVIVGKSFERHLAVRATGEQLLRAALGEADLPDPSGDSVSEPDAGAPPEVEVTVDVDREPLAHGMQRDLRVQLRVPPGRHLYGEPVPEGMVATSVDFADGIQALPAQAPPTHPHVLAGTGETLHVYEGDVHLVAPFAVTGGHRSPTKGVHLVTGTVRFQSCDDESCGLPKSVPFSVEIPMDRPVVPHFGGAEEGQMDFTTHFERMTTRRA